MSFGSYKPVPRSVSALLAGIVLLGALLRFHGLDRDSFWFDEYQYTLAVADQTNLGAALDEARRNLQPPFHTVWVYAAFRAGQVDEWWARLPSAFFGTWAIVLIFLVAQRLYTHREGLFSALFMAVLWCPIYYGQEARAYALLTALVLGAMWCWLGVMEAMEEGRPMPWGRAAGYALLSALSGMTHHFGLLLAALQGVFACFYFLRRREALLRIAVVYGLAVVCFTPWIPGFLQILTFAKQGDVSYFHPPYLKDVFDVYRYFFNGTKQVFLPVCGLYAVGLYYGIQNFRRKKAEAPNTGPVPNLLRTPGMLLSLWACVPVVVMYIESLALQPMFVNRYFQIVMPACYILLARAFMNLPFSNRERDISVGGAALVFLAHLLFVMNFYTQPQKEPVRQAVDYVVERDQPAQSALVLGFYGLSSGHFLDYYFSRLGSPRRVHLPVFTAEDLSMVCDAVERYKPERLYYLVAHPADPAPAVLAYLNKHFVRRDFHEWLLPKKKPRVRVWLFEAKPVARSAP